MIKKLKKSKKIKTCDILLRNSIIEDDIINEPGNYDYNKEKNKLLLQLLELENKSEKIYENLKKNKPKKKKKSIISKLKSNNLIDSDYHVNSSILIPDLEEKLGELQELSKDSLQDYNPSIYNLNTDIQQTVNELNENSNLFSNTFDEYSKKRKRKNKGESKNINKKSKKNYGNDDIIEEKSINFKGLIKN